MKFYGIKFYLGKDIGWLFLTESWGTIKRFETEDKAEEYVKSMDFENNKYIYEIEEVPEYETE
jgi:hypothetical protein